MCLAFALLVLIMLQQEQTMIKHANLSIYKQVTGASE